MIQTFTAKRQFIANFGLNTFIETEWVRLRVPSLLRTFWLTRFTQQLLGKTTLFSQYQYQWPQFWKRSQNFINKLFSLAYHLPFKETFNFDWNYRMRTYPGLSTNLFHENSFPVSLHVLSLNSNWNVTSAETATKLAVETMILIAKVNIRAFNPYCYNV